MIFLLFPLFEGMGKVTLLVYQISHIFYLPIHPLKNMQKKDKTKHGLIYAIGSRQRFFLFRATH